jgi:hypothetical protein
MNHSEIIHKLSDNLAFFDDLLNINDHSEITWKETPERWSILEIVCHLYDEEREDFRARIKHVFETPELPLPPIDPAGWVTSRGYMQWNYQDTLGKFSEERKNSVRWLQSLNNPQWKNVHHHPKFGAMSAEMFLANWLAHDYLHFRQIIKIKFDYLKHTSGETLKYAGAW